MRGISLGIPLSVIMGVVGCGKPAEKPAAPDESEKQSATHKHDGWWCTEHGVPEEVCALCDSTLVAKFKQDGDWCQDHERPDSQCFACHPEREATFAAEYEARYGEKPPRPSDIP